MGDINVRSFQDPENTILGIAKCLTLPDEAGESVGLVFDLTDSFLTSKAGLSQKRPLRNGIVASFGPRALKQENSVPTHSMDLASESTRL